MSSKVSFPFDIFVFQSLNSSSTYIFAFLAFKTYGNDYLHFVQVEIFSAAISLIISFLLRAIESQAELVGALEVILRLLTFLGALCCLLIPGNGGLALGLLLASLSFPVKLFSKKTPNWVFVLFFARCPFLILIFVYEFHILLSLSLFFLPNLAVGLSFFVSSISGWRKSIKAFLGGPETYRSLQSAILDFSFFSLFVVTFFGLYHQLFFDASLIGVSFLMLERLLRSAISFLAPYFFRFNFSSSYGYIFSSMAVYLLCIAYFGFGLRISFVFIGPTFDLCLLFLQPSRFNRVVQGIGCAVLSLCIFYNAVFF